MTVSSKKETVILSAVFFESYTCIMLYPSLLERGEKPNKLIITDTNHYPYYVTVSVLGFI